METIAASLRTYRLDLQYHGAPFDGWQSQPGGRGVQDHVEAALAVLLGHPLRVLGASRTDSGVHAEHQVATFRTRAAFDAERWLKTLGGLLPETIGATAVAPVDAAFHPARDALAKAYRYRILHGPARRPLVAPFCWHIMAPLDAPALAAEARLAVGTHDFRSFCAGDSAAKTFERTILEIEVHTSGALIEVWVVGRGFLKQMVRILVGHLVDVARGRLPAGALAAVLAARDRGAASRTAPAQGLSLVEIFYDDVPTTAALRKRLGAGFSVRLG